MKGTRRSSARYILVHGAAGAALVLLAFACKAPDDKPDAMPFDWGEADAQASPADAGRDMQDAAEDVQCSTNTDCNDGVGCTQDSCDLEASVCVHTPNDDACQEGGFCNGVEVCDRVNDCQAGAPPTMAPGVTCTSGQIAAGQSHTCFLITDGSVKCWGDGTLGQLGNARRDKVGDDDVPALEAALDFDGGVVVQVATGGAHTCILQASGQVRCWGRGDEGQLGYGNTNDIDDVTQSGFVNLNGTAVQITAGDAHTCALLNDGNVKCWGRGVEGQIGNGGFENVGDDESPVLAGRIDLGFNENNQPFSAKQIVAGGAHTCVVLNDGRVKCWGSSELGQLGNGSTENMNVPIFANIGTDIAPKDSPVDVAQLAAGRHHTCALLNVGGVVRCWGRGDEGQLGYGNTNNIGDNELALEAGDVLVGGGTVVEITAGGAHTCARSSIGRVRCWGRAAEGQIGYGNTENIGDDEAPSTVVEDIALGETAVQLTAGGSHTCALLDTGSARCWGLNNAGQLGLGYTENIGDDESPATAGNVLATPSDISGTSL